ncbi:HIT family protein [Aurantimonas sp. MSK8Z-1]|uniref:HIT domain-containing protein n=1 Tax=Mangrovibrevibacter kandeliae TaxID=2968473 RepID=UPI002117583F|nr:HIT family protein [Aurantimonas sp. MSK8Z-1]MCW4116016.1 HIT family protein [Aurantimonas sp. MSK8Z-1]
MRTFRLDPRLARDTLGVARLGLCELRLMNDSRWPWVVLVPQREAITEFYELSPLDQTMLTFETDLVARAFKALTGADKLNIATIGNVVSMFHLHIVARFAGDANWPGPVWGFGMAEPYEAARAQALVSDIARAVLPA